VSGRIPTDFPLEKRYCSQALSSSRSDAQARASAASSIHQEAGLRAHTSPAAWDGIRFFAGVKRGTGA